MSFSPEQGLSGEDSERSPRLAAPEQSPTTPRGALRPDPETNEGILVIGRPLARAHISGLCDRAQTILETRARTVLDCDVGALVDPDAVVVDAVARLQLTARRLGAEIRLRDASPRLQELLAFVGLSEVVAVCD